MREFEFLGRLVILFKRSKKAYEQYIKSGQILLFAKILRECNESIVKELLAHSYLLQDNLFDDTIELINHYDIWIQLWDNLYSSDSFNLQDKFVFENSYTFPRESEKNLIDRFNTLKNEIDGVE
jgi:hypothetical protein